MLISRNLHKKSCEVSIKALSTPASLSFKGQVTKHTTVKWSIPTDEIHKQDTINKHYKARGLKTKTRITITEMLLNEIVRTK